MDNVLKFAILIVIVGGLSSCGGGGGSGASSVDSEKTYSSPSWINKDWKVVRLRYGVNVERLNMTMSVSGGNFEYHYPECDVYGQIAMDETLPIYVGNEYYILMTEVVGSCTWDIDSYVGASDGGVIWGEENGVTFYRVSYYDNIIWIYYLL